MKAGVRDRRTHCREHSESAGRAIVEVRVERERAGPALIESDTGRRGAADGIGADAVCSSAPERVWGCSPKHNTNRRRNRAPRSFWRTVAFNVR